MLQNACSNVATYWKHLCLEKQRHGKLKNAFVVLFRGKFSEEKMDFC
jgi:hypothetical protein